MTYADIAVVDLLLRLQDRDDPLLLHLGGDPADRAAMVRGTGGQCPGLLELVGRVTENPGIKKYLGEGGEKRR